MSGCDPKLVDPDPFVSNPDLNALHNYLNRLLDYFVASGYRTQAWGWRYKVRFNKDTREWEARARIYEWSNNG